MSGRAAAHQEVYGAVSHPVVRPSLRFRSGGPRWGSLSSLIALLAIFAAAKLFGELAERIGQPAVLGEMVGGIVIGVSGLHLIDPHNTVLHVLAELGVLLLLLSHRIGDRHSASPLRRRSPRLHTSVAMMVMTTTFVAPPALLAKQAREDAARALCDVVTEAINDDEDRREGESRNSETAG